MNNRTKCLQHEQLFDSLPSKSPTATSTYLHRGDIGMARILCKSTRRSLLVIRGRCTERRYLLDKGKNSMARPCSERTVCVMITSTACSSFPLTISSENYLWAVELRNHLKCEHSSLCMAINRKHGRSTIHS